MLLSRVVGALLIDLAAAQDVANEYSSQLALKYKKYSDEMSEVLSNFNVPNGALKEVELELRFAVSNVEARESRSNLVAAIEIFHRYAREATQKAVALLSRFIETTTMLINGEFRQEWDKIRENINSQRFMTYLTEQVTKKLLQQRDRLLNDDGSLKQAEIRGAIADVFEHQLQGHEDLKTRLGPESQAGQELRNQYRQMMDTLFEDFEDAAQLSRASSVIPSLDIIVSPERLQDLPCEIVSSLRIKAELANYQWTITETSASLNRIQ